MAAQVVLENVQHKKNMEIEQNFELAVKQRLVWNNKKWQEEGEQGSRLHKVINSMKFWSPKLKNAQGIFNVILGLYNSEREIALSLMNIIDELDKLGVGDKIIGFNTFRNPRYLNLSFDSNETKGFVEKNLKKVGNSNVIFLSWVNSVAVTVIKFHWVPIEVTVEHLIEYLEKYATIGSYIREEFNLLDGRVLKNGTVTFQTSIKEGVDIKDIPHLCNITGLEFLINITGREILCLTCGRLGHKASECDTPFCKFCKKKQKRLHECIARRAESNENVQIVAETCSTDGVSENVVMNTGLKSQVVSQVLSDKDLKEINDSAKNYWRTAKNSAEEEENYNSGTIEEKAGNGEMGESKEDYTSEEDQEENDNETVNNMKTYFEELQKFKKLSDNIMNKGSDTDQDVSVSKGQDFDDNSMDFETLRCKRKLELDNKGIIKEEVINSRRTYGRRGGRGVGSSRSTQNCETLFQACLKK